MAYRRRQTTDVSLADTLTKIERLASSIRFLLGGAIIAKSVLKNVFEAIHLTDARADAHKAEPGGESR